jgi:predicted thioredoxin/glutaredoxin
VLAQQSAKNAVKNHLRRQGLKLWDFTSKEITLRAEAMLKEHPEMFAEARAKAVSLGFVQEIAQ